MWTPQDSPVSLPPNSSISVRTTTQPRHQATSLVTLVSQASSHNQTREDVTRTPTCQVVRGPLMLQEQTSVLTLVIFVTQDSSSTLQMAVKPRTSPSVPPTIVSTAPPSNALPAKTDTTSTPPKSAKPDWSLTVRPTQPLSKPASGLLPQARETLHALSAKTTTSYSALRIMRPTAWPSQPLLDARLVPTLSLVRRSSSPAQLVLAEAKLFKQEMSTPTSPTPASTSTLLPIVLPITW